MKAMKRLLLFLLCQGSLDGFSQSQWPCGTPFVSKVVRIDTMPSHILVAHHPPSFTKSLEGYCITQDSVCTNKHLLHRKRFGKWVYIPVTYTYDVFGCIRKGVYRPAKKEIDMVRVCEYYVPKIRKDTTGSVPVNSGESW